MSPAELRRLLELAAKAAGMPEKWTGDGIYVREQFCEVPWNPVENDGDALRLEVDMKFTAAWEPMRGGWSIGAIVNGEFKWLVFHEDRKQASVRAAAAIGEAMT